MAKKQSTDKQLRLLGFRNELELSKFKKEIKVNMKRSADKQINTSNLFFDNLITVEELSTIFRVAPQTIRNWVACGKFLISKLEDGIFFKKGAFKSGSTKRRNHYGNS